MTTLRRFALISTLLLVFVACSSGGSDDDAVERPRDVETAAADEPTHADEHVDHHDADIGGVDTGRADGDMHTVEVEMTEFGYEPSEIVVPAGEPVAFVFHNVGVIDHEAMVGDDHMQEEFASMGGHGDHDAMDNHHGDVRAVTVPPGETAELVMTFDESGETMLGCHIEGHWEAGMVGTVTVT